VDAGRAGIRLGCGCFTAGELCGSLADPVLIGDGAPAGCAALACAAHAACLLELAQQQEHLIATRAGSFGEVRVGHAVAVGQQLLGGLGRQGLSRLGLSLRLLPATFIRLRPRFGRRWTG
jgi:hypothetical protein